MQEEILTLQFGAFSNRILDEYWGTEQLNFAETLKTNPDAVLNSTFIKGDISKPRTLIFDMKENLQKYSFYQTNIDPENEKAKFQHWEKEKIQVFEIGEEVKVEEMKKAPPAFSRFLLSERNFARIPSTDNYFNVFQHGGLILQSTEQVDAIEEKMRYFLEDSDYLRAFQCFLDTNSGYGYLNKYVLQYLSEECPKRPVFQYAFDNDHYTSNIENEKILPSLRFLNKMVSLYELKEFATFYFPIDIDNVLHFQGLNRGLLATAPGKAYDLLSLIVSNISLAYRFSHIGADSDSIKGYAEGLLTYPELNIFNACFQIGGYPQVLGKTFSEESLDANQSIFNYKEYKPLCLFTLPPKDKKLKDYTTFAEDFVIRGHIQDVKIPKEFNAVTHNYHIQETDILLPEDMTKLFDPKLLSRFDVVPQGIHSIPIQKIATQSCIFSNEVFQFYFEEIVKQYKKVERGAKLQFLKEDYSEDEFKEMEHFYLNLRDSYDNARQDKSGEEEDDDDDY